MDNLVQELDKDLEQFIEERIRNSQSQPKYWDSEGKTVDEVADELKQHPAFLTEIDESKPLHPALEALQLLKYESSSNDDNAESYKEDGNKNFAKKKYRWAADNYTAGIDCKPSDNQLLTVLYTNRAAAQFHIGNYRSSLDDSIKALKVTPKHKKAWIRALKCYVKLEKHQDVISWCDKAVTLFPDEKEFVESRDNAEQQQKRRDRDERMAKAKERKMLKERAKVVDTIKARNIRSFSLARGQMGLTDDEWMDLVNEEYNGSRVELVVGDDGQSFLSWPVLFLYPEHNQSDFIVGFSENASFSDQLEMMFGNESPGWDEERAYKPESIEIFYEEKKSNDDCVLQVVDPRMRLVDILQNKKFKLCHSTVTFFLLIKNSDYKKSFVENYGKI